MKDCPIFHFKLENKEWLYGTYKLPIGIRVPDASEYINGYDVKEIDKKGMPQILLKVIN